MKKKKHWMEKAVRWQRALEKPKSKALKDVVLEMYICMHAVTLAWELERETDGRHVVPKEAGLVNMPPQGAPSLSRTASRGVRVRGRRSCL